MEETKNTNEYNLQNALITLINAIEVGQRNGIYTLGDAKLILTAIDYLYQMDYLKEKVEETK